MRYTKQVAINLPRDKVIELFDNPDNLKKWQPSLQSFEHVSGEVGQKGAKSRLIYNERNRTMEMTETIEKRALPDEFTAIYEAKGVWNRVCNRFYEEDKSNTLWEMETEFRFSGFMKVFGLLMGGAFPKQTHQTMNDFKIFAESA